MEWYVIGLIVLGILLLFSNGFLLWLFLDTADNRRFYEDQFKSSFDKILKLKERLKKEINNAKYWFDKCQRIENSYSTKQLKQKLEEQKLKEKYPLAHEIKHIDCEFVELYIDGQLYKKCTREYAWKYVKSYGKDKDITYMEVE